MIRISDSASSTLADNEEEKETKTASGDSDNSGDDAGFISIKQDE